MATPVSMPGERMVNDVTLRHEHQGFDGSEAREKTVRLPIIGDAENDIAAGARDETAHPDGQGRKGRIFEEGAVAALPVFVRANLKISDDAHEFAAKLPLGEGKGKTVLLLVDGIGACDVAHPECMLRRAQTEGQCDAAAPGEPRGLLIQLEAHPMLARHEVLAGLPAERSEFRTRGRVADAPGSSKLEKLQVGEQIGPHQEEPRIDRVVGTFRNRIPRPYIGSEAQLIGQIESSPQEAPRATCFAARLIGAFARTRLVLTSQQKLALRPPLHRQKARARRIGMA